MGGPSAEAPVPQMERCLISQAVYVPDRVAYSNRKTGLVRSSSHEAHPVASKATLACPGSIGKDHPCIQISPSASGLVVGRGKCTTRSAFTSPRPCSSVIYRHVKYRLGHAHCKRHVVTHRKLSVHQFPIVKGSVSGQQEL